MVASRRPQLINKDHGGDDVFTLSSQQLLAVQDPKTPISTVIADRHGHFEGRPYRVWRDDPDLARSINDRLAKTRK